MKFKKNKSGNQRNLFWPTFSNPQLQKCFAKPERYCTGTVLKKLPGTRYFFFFRFQYVYFNIHENKVFFKWCISPSKQYFYCLLLGLRPIFWCDIVETSQIQKKENSLYFFLTKKSKHTVKKIPITITLRIAQNARYSYFAHLWKFW